MAAFNYNTVAAGRSLAMIEALEFLGRPTRTPLGEERRDLSPPFGQPHRQLRERYPRGVLERNQEVSDLFELRLWFLTEASPQEFENIHANADAVEIAS